MDCHQTTVHSITNLRLQIQQLTGIITNMADRFARLPPLSSLLVTPPSAASTDNKVGVGADESMEIRETTGDTPDDSAAQTHSSSMSVQSRSSTSTGTGSSSSSLPPPPQQNTPRTLHSNMEQLSLISGNQTPSTTEDQVTDPTPNLPTTSPTLRPLSLTTPTSPMGSTDSFEDISDDILHPLEALPGLNRQYISTPAPDGGDKEKCQFPAPLQHIPHPARCMQPRTTRQEFHLPVPRFTQTASLVTKDPNPQHHHINFLAQTPSVSPAARGALN